MTTEHDLARSRGAPQSPTQDDDLAPGRGSRSSQLAAPAHPIAGGLLLRKARDANGVAEGADTAIAAASSSTGSPLPEAVKRKFESSLGTDLSSVRIHTGSNSANAAHAVSARAYTIGQDIHFGAGQYDPSTSSGQHLIAHEVAHTVQQRGGSPMRQHKLEVSAPGDAAELEADRAANAMVVGAPAAVGSAARIAARVDSLSDAADRGGATMGEAMQSPQVAVMNVSNIEDKQAAGALLRTIESYDGDIKTGIADNQIKDGSVATANGTAETLLRNYLQAAEAQTVEISTFQGLFGGLMKDFGRLNEMMKTVDGVDLATLKDPSAAGKQGAGQAREIFNGQDPRTETAALMKDQTLKNKMKLVTAKRTTLTQYGKDVIAKGNTVANAFQEMSSLQRNFTAKANTVKTPEAQEQLDAAKARAKHDYSSAAGKVLKDALMGAVSGIAEGPAGAAEGAGKAAAKSTWDNVIKPKIDEALQDADISVGKFPDNSAEANQRAADMQAWDELSSIAKRLTGKRNEARQGTDALGTAFESYQSQRDIYELEMVELGVEMDKKSKAMHAPAPKDPCVCDPNAKPTPPPKDQGPRYETVMQFLAEADRFIAQAEVVKTQGEKELVIQKGNSAAQAHDTLVDATLSAKRPTFWYSVNKMEVRGADGKPFTKFTPVRNSYTLHNGLNPGAGDNPSASAEGQGGANDTIADHLKKVADVRAKIEAYRNQLARAVGLG